MRRRAIELLLLLTIVGSALFLAGEARREIADPGDSDALSFITGTHLLGDDPAHLYDETTQRRFQAQALGISVDQGYFSVANTLPAATLLQSPLAALDIHEETAALIVLDVVALLVALVLGLRLVEASTTRPETVLLAVSAIAILPALSNPTHWDFAITAAALGAMLLAPRRPLVAGLLLSACVIKPQAALLLLPALVAARSWRLLAGVVAGGGLWLLLSLVPDGIDGVVAYVRLVLNSHFNETELAQQSSLPGLVAAATGSGAAATVTAVVLIGAAWIGLLAVGAQWLRGRPVEAIALALAGSALLSPHLSWQDTVLFAPALLLAGRSGRALPAQLLVVALDAAWWVDNGHPAARVHLAPVVMLAMVAVMAGLSRGRLTKAGAS
jgi:hypothetical protein